MCAFNLHSLLSLQNLMTILSLSLRFFVFVHPIKCRLRVYEKIISREKREREREI
jgi:hypothetical protein